MVAVRAVIACSSTVAVRAGVQEVSPQIPSGATQGVPSSKWIYINNQPSWGHSSKIINEYKLSDIPSYILQWLLWFNNDGNIDWWWCMIVVNLHYNDYECCYVYAQHLQEILITDDTAGAIKWITTWWHMRGIIHTTIIELVEITSLGQLSFICTL